MEKLSELLFELSSIDRMKIVLSLQKQGLKLSHISQKLDITVTEASRHLQRLSDAKLVKKDADGLYHITFYGELVLSQLSGLEFVSTHSQYFTEHIMSHLPYEFLGRIGELTNCTLDTDTVRVFGYAENMLREADEYIWLQSYQVLLWTTPVIGEKVNRGVDFRFIYPRDIIPPPGFKLNSAPASNQRNLERLDCRILITEKEVQLSLPYTNGNIDYAAFMSRDPKFHKWCKDLFLVNWERAKP